MATRSLGTLTIDLIARTLGFEQGMDRAARSTDKRMKEIERSAKRIGTAVGASLVAAGVSVAAFAKQAIDAADELSQMAVKTGVSTEALSQLDYAAKLSDVSLDDLGASLTRLTKFMVESADAGSEQARIFEALGIEAKDATGGLRDADDVLSDLADVFAKLPDGAEKTALAVKVFGKSGAELIPLLNNGADGLAEFARKADLVGYTLNDNTGRAANDFNDKLEEMKLGIDGLWRQSLPELLPDLKKFADLLNGDDFRDGFQTIISGSVTAVGWLAKFATTTANVTKFLGEEIASRASGPALDDPVRIQQAIERQQRLLDQLDQKGTGAERRNTSQYADDQRAELKRLQDMLSLSEEMTQEQASRAKLVEDAANRAPTTPTLAGLGLLDPEGGNAKGGRSGRTSTPRDLAADFLGEDRRALEDQLRAVTEANREFEALAATLSGPLAEANYRYAVDLERLNQLAKDGEVSTDELAKAQQDLAKQHTADLEAIEAQLHPAREYIKQLQEEVAWLGATEEGQRKLEAARIAGANATAAELAELEDWLRTRDAMQEANQNWDNLQDSISDGLFDIATGSVSARDAVESFLDNLNAQILRNITDDWADSITDFFKGLGSQTGGDGGWFSSLLGAVGFGGGRASGGTARPNTVYEVNERGIEMARVRGRDYMLTGDSPVEVTPNSRIGGGGLSVTQIINNPQYTDPRSRSQILQDSATSLRTAASRNG